MNLIEGGAALTRNWRQPAGKPAGSLPKLAARILPDAEGPKEGKGMVGTPLEHKAALRDSPLRPHLGNLRTPSGGGF